LQQPEVRIVQVDRRPGEVRFPGEPIAEARRILVVRDGRLRDVVLTLPALQALRTTYPAAWIGLLVNPRFHPLATMFEDVDEVFGDPGTVGGVERLLGRFRPDLLVCASRKSTAALAAWKGGIPNRVGPGYRLWSPIFHRRVDERAAGGDRHEVECALSFAHRAGAPGGEALFRVTLAERAVECAGNWLDMHRVGRPFVVLHPGAATSCPPWPAGHFVQLATLLEAEGVPVVISVGPGDVAVTQALEEEHPRIRRLPRFAGDLVTLAAIVSEDCVVAGGSGGPLHLAAALGSPTVAVHPPFPECSPDRWGPYARNGWAILPGHADARNWSRRVRRAQGDRLMAGIPPTAVMRCVRAVMDGQRPESPD
jgi:ADP-heptose:LPS heptosyltransferase